VANFICRIDREQLRAVRAQLDRRGQANLGWGATQAVGQRITPFGVDESGNLGIAIVVET